MPQSGQPTLPQRELSLKVLTLGIVKKRKMRQKGSFGYLIFDYSEPLVPLVYLSLLVLCKGKGLLLYPLDRLDL